MKNKSNGNSKSNCVLSGWELEFDTLIKGLIESAREEGKVYWEPSEHHKDVFRNEGRAAECEEQNRINNSGGKLYKMGYAAALEEVKKMLEKQHTQFDGYYLYKDLIEKSPATNIPFEVAMDFMGELKSFIRGIRNATLEEAADKIQVHRAAFGKDDSNGNNTLNACIATIRSLKK